MVGADGIPVCHPERSRLSGEVRDLRINSLVRKPHCTTIRASQTMNFAGNLC